MLLTVLTIGILTLHRLDSASERFQGFINFAVITIFLIAGIAYTKAFGAISTTTTLGFAAAALAAHGISNLIDHIVKPDNLPLLTISMVVSTIVASILDAKENSISIKWIGIVYGTQFATIFIMSRLAGSDTKLLVGAIGTLVLWGTYVVNKRIVCVVA